MKLLIAVMFAGSMFLTSCEKEMSICEMNETGSPKQTRGDEIIEDGTDPGDGNGITDGGHDSDYDNSGKGKKNKSN